MKRRKRKAGLIGKILYQIALRRNWKARTSDAPKAFKVTEKP